MNNEYWSTVVVIIIFIYSSTINYFTRVGVHYHWMMMSLRWSKCLSLGLLWNHRNNYREKNGKLKSFIIFIRVYFSLFTINCTILIIRCVQLPFSITSLFILTNITGHWSLIFFFPSATSTSTISCLSLVPFSFTISGWIIVRLWVSISSIVIVVVNSFLNLQKHGITIN